MAAIATTLATSEPGVSELEIEASFTAWESSLVLGKDEGSGQTFLSIPTELLEGSTMEWEVFVVVDVDRTQHDISPSTDWSITYGDLTEPAHTFTSPLSALTETREGMFNEPWESVFHDFMPTISIVGDPSACASGACLPCDTSLQRCEMMITVERASASQPRTKLSLSGTLRGAGAQDSSSSQEGP